MLETAPSTSLHMTLVSSVMQTLNSVTLEESVMQTLNIV